jgi:hypothetical protein
MRLSPKWFAAGQEGAHNPDGILLRSCCDALNDVHNDRLLGFTFTTIYPITRRGIAMNTRILSWVVNRVVMLAIMTATISMFSSNASGQSSSGYLTNPETGIVYRKVTKTIETPVVETQVNTSEQTVYRPQTITETRPHSRTIYSPVVEYKLEPRLYGRWNPFRPPTVAYQHVPHTTWEARNEVVHRTNTRTEWVAERSTVEVPTQVVRMQREHKVDFEPVGRVSQPQGPPGATDALASRLRPLDNNEAIEPFGSSVYGVPRIA